MFLILLNEFHVMCVENGTSHSHDGKKSYIGLNEVNLNEVLVVVGKSIERILK